MRIFISCAHEDRSQAEHLEQRLLGLGHSPWSDSGLHGGQAWWNEFLDRIHESDALLLLIFLSFVASQACLLERRYAALLDKQSEPMRGRRSLNPLVLDQGLFDPEAVDRLHKSKRTFEEYKPKILELFGEEIESRRRGFGDLQREYGVGPCDLVNDQLGRWPARGLLAQTLPVPSKGG